MDLCPLLIEQSKKYCKHFDGLQGSHIHPWTFELAQHEQVAERVLRKLEDKLDI